MSLIGSAIVLGFIGGLGGSLVALAWLLERPWFDRLTNTLMRVLFGGGGPWRI